VIFLLALALVFLVIVLSTVVVEAWARHRHWEGYDDRDVRYEPRRPGGRPW
jgi:hypothetical protein